jgi:hypothetical protein
VKLAAVILAACLAGCVAPPPKPAAARVSFDASGALNFEQVDFAEVPATVSTSEESLTLEIPAGSGVSFGDMDALPGDRSVTVTDSPSPSAGGSHRDGIELPAAWSITLSEPTTLHASRRFVSISGPKSFPPPLAPSLGEKTAARALWLWRVGLFAGLILAGLGVWWKGGLVIAGGLSVAGASAFGWFVEENPWLLWIFGGGVALAALGYALWHLWLKRRVTKPSVSGLGLAVASR